MVMRSINATEIIRRSSRWDGIDHRRRREGPNIPGIQPCVSCGLDDSKLFGWWEGCRNNGH